MTYNDNIGGAYGLGELYPRMEEEKFGSPGGEGAGCGQR